MIPIIFILITWFQKYTHHKILLHKITCFLKKIRKILNEKYVLKYLTSLKSLRNFKKSEDPRFFFLIIYYLYYNVDDFPEI